MPLKNGLTGYAPAIETVRQSYVTPTENDISYRLSIINRGALVATVIRVTGLIPSENNESVQGGTSNTTARVI